MDTSRRSVRVQYGEWARKAYTETLLVLRKYKVDTVSIRTDQDYVKSLVALFQTQGIKRKVMKYRMLNILATAVSAVVLSVLTAGAQEIVSAGVSKDTILIGVRWSGHPG